MVARDRKEGAKWLHPRCHTKVEQDGETAPRMPHERDQSSESQKNPGGEATEVGKQAFKDVESGAVDTDRAPVTDKVYNEKLKR